MPIIKPPPRTESGFTMVVIAALFIAFAVIAAVAVERSTTVQQITRRDAARDQLQRISNALIEYSVFHYTTMNLYPCPASPKLLSSDTNFGTSVNNGASAQDCATVDHTGADALTVTTPVIRGMVPVQELSTYGIGLNDAFDPWNNRIMYVVNRNLTVGSIAPTQADTPTITYPATGLAIPNPDFILISYGKDGVGAYKRDKTAIDIACAAGSGIYRLINCGNTTTAYVSMPTYTGGGANGTSTTINTSIYFDDILTWYRQ